MGSSLKDFDALDIGTLRRLLVSALQEIEILREETDRLGERIIRLQEENQALRSGVRSLQPLGDSDTMQRLFEQLRRIGPSDETITLTGPTTVGGMTWFVTLGSVPH